jgi:hypothetical protein
MANVLKMALIESILSLHAQRWSQRRIARELQVDRETVRKYLRQELTGAKPAIAPAGSGGSKPATFPNLPAPGSKPATNLPTGSDGGPAGESAGLASQSPSAPLGPPGPQSRCEPFREAILAKMAEDLSAKRIWQDLQRTAAKQEPLPFLEEHPIIRPMSDYGAIVTQAIHRQDSRSSVSEGLERHGGAMMLCPTQQKSPGDRVAQGLAASPPRSGYPSPGCTSAEPGSVSPDSSTIVPPSSFHQEKSDE